MLHVLAGVSGAASVGLGAMGAHALKGKKPEEVASWKSAVQYHQIHSLALAVAHLSQPCLGRTMAGVFFTSGIVLFSGSIYTYILTGEKKVSGVAPVGGLCFMAGWLSMILLKRPLPVP